MEKSKLYQRIRKLPLVSAKLIEGLFAGNYRSVFRGPGLEFDEVREYTDEDDYRNIDWNVSSRMDSPYAKTYREERELTLFLLIDTSPSMFTGTRESSKMETGEIVSAMFAFAAAYNNDRVGAAFFTDRIEKWVPAAKGKKHVARLVRDMEQIQPQGHGSDLGLALKTFRENQKTRGICIIISDFRTMTGWPELSMIKKHHDIIPVRITDPGDRDFPETGLAELIDPETRRAVHSLGLNRGFRREWTTYFHVEETRIRNEFKRRGIPLLSIDTGDDPVEAVTRFLRRRRRR
ncbi:MAG: DUF58 domain-containing protein [Spirochaetales bacterium]|nr:DUF58 domain-containing protein [Spirochaetales bacterium]